MFGLDVCGVHSVCSVYEVSGLVAFVGPMGRWDWTLVAFTALIAFMGIGVGCSGIYSICFIYGVFGLDFWGVHSIGSASGMFRLVFYLFIYFSCGVAFSRLWCIGMEPLW